MTFTPEFDARLHAAVGSLANSEALAAQVAAELDAFFERHPDLQRTRTAALFASVIIFDRLTQTAETPKTP